MSSFESVQDAAFALKYEGQEIKINLKKGVPTTGQATVEWTIPKPYTGCASDTVGAYSGILILLNTEAMDGTNIPQDDKIYVSDNTANYDLNTGDRIGNALVVGAFYECEKKGRGEDLTISMVINDLDPKLSYYVAGYALDCENRYHSDGIRAYSDVYSDKDNGDIPAAQIIRVGTNGNGVVPTDGTGLVAGMDYEFDLIYDNTFPEGTDFKTIEITIDGLDAGTYQQLIDTINDRIALIENPTQSPVPPNAGRFYWNDMEQKLFQFDGYVYTEIDAVVEPTDPSNVSAGTYWFDTTTKVLQRWNIPNPTGWNLISYVESEIDPTSPDCDTYWFDSALGRVWNGATWCEKDTIISATNPVDCPVVPCGTYWYNETDEILNVWDEQEKRWVEVFAIFWNEQPNNISNGTYWFDDTNQTLSIRSTGTWVDISSTTAIQDTEPSPKVDGMLWYSPINEELQQYVAITDIWIMLPVLVWMEDPTIVESCDLWWNSVDDNLYAWDSINSTWDLVASFIKGILDPAQPPILEVGSLWYDTANVILFKWDGTDWVAVAFINKPTDPTVPVFGDSWHKPSTNEWFVWDTPAAGWNLINPTDSDFDPNTIPNGTYWYDTTNEVLFVRNATTWMSVAFSRQPFIMLRGELWYDTANKILYEWDGSTWILSTPVALATFDKNGNILFFTAERGSNTAILVPATEGSISSSSPCTIGTGFAFHGVNDIGQSECEYTTATNVRRFYPARDISDDIFLWSNLLPTANIIPPNGGNDGRSEVPSYLEDGVGTDGTPDERRELMDSLRRQLGHPVVTVELDNVQLDTCVSLALENYRQKAGGAYRRGFFFLDIEHGKQKYLLTNKVIGYNRIVTIMSAYRFTSAFLSSAHGAGAYGQIVLQHLYNMGTYDLTSFHLVSQYVEQLEMLFATRLTFGWHENDRILSFYSSFTRVERVLLDCMVERTEQDLLKDRYSKPWIERYALSEAMMMLSQIRGKFASLPGAGGGISLNAAELVTLAQSYRDELMSQIEDFVADVPEDVGLQSTVILG